MSCKRFRVAVDTGRERLSNSILICDDVAWQALEIGYANIASACANKASGLFRSGFLMYVLQSSSRKLTSSLLPSLPASMKPMTRRSSMPSPSIGTRRSPASETRRHLHRRRAWCIHRNATARSHRPGRSVRLNRFGHGVPVDDESGRGAPDPDYRRAHPRHRDRPAKPRHGRQDHDDATGESARSPRPSRRCRSCST